MLSNLAVKSSSDNAGLPATTTLSSSSSSTTCIPRPTGDAFTGGERIEARNWMRLNVYDALITSIREIVDVYFADAFDARDVRIFALRNLIYTPEKIEERVAGGILQEGECRGLQHTALWGEVTEHAQTIMRCAEALRGALDRTLDAEEAARAAD